VQFSGANSMSRKIERPNNSESKHDTQQIGSVQHTFTAGTELM